ncbi:hypothetical protein PF005_g32213 [Phytophthora fragariae]|uniref:Secreted protein n=1 Tax=Phytophthora fragariae TaxID=53985 RepID=A0A6A3DB81_9STRA|nr:hypothetical protein PF003_g25656 [Phytophthora fragariae]KAE8917473.1 hypothetical protein PF009_g32206 [Phytophthora fragariae]KAE8974252.1 hypothetical protein PF011_g24934 [Phytophthora fragariae]KAE9056683.1 hypothetical protein PF010_g31673 [Phytophthora fragariae]KAE9057018.1 hypothetical protein PF007_g31793 [Phytophthora fragariae]
MHKGPFFFVFLDFAQHSAAVLLGYIERVNDVCRRNVGSCSVVGVLGGIERGAAGVESGSNDDGEDVGEA